MPQPGPLRNRPNLHLALTQLNGSPRQSIQSTPFASRSSTPVQFPADTPFGKTAYSPFRSAILTPPTSFGSPAAFAPRRSNKFSYRNNGSFRFRRALSSKPVWLFLTVLALIMWWFNGGSEEINVVKISASSLGKDILEGMRMHNYQFFPATNPKIHGSTLAGGLSHQIDYGKMEIFLAGVYFDITVRNTSSLLLALHNAQETAVNPASAFSPPAPQHRHFHFSPAGNHQKPAPPISLIARVDDQEYVFLPNASSIVAVRSQDLDPNIEHHVRIIAPMTDGCGEGVVELDGFWLTKGGQLVKVPGSLLSEDYANEDSLEADNDKVGEKHRHGLVKIGRSSSRNSGQTASDTVPSRTKDDFHQYRRKVLEVVTDSPGSIFGKGRANGLKGASSLMGGVTGWEYLLGEMFEADHTCIGMDGMCLTQGCVGGRGQPNGMGDVFFRSGPIGSWAFDDPWMFSAYVPDVLIFNLGAADYSSFDAFGEEYNKTFWEFSEVFESTYVSLIKAIRDLAYPKHPEIVQSERSGRPGVISNARAATIPIFIMRPLRGQLEQSTQKVVAKLRADGDKSVFWLDTSGWLDPAIHDDEVSDFFMDATVTPARYRLTEQGNQRVAIFLHMHVCRYLARVEVECAFLPPEVYSGKVFNEEEARFDKYLEDEKERKLKNLFWEMEARPAEEGGRLA